MLKMSKEMWDFLGGTNKANSGKGEVRGFPAHVWKNIIFSQKAGMFRVSSGHSINGGYD